MKARKLNSSNPEHLLYENTYLHLAVLGGIKLEGLHKLQATLKISLVDSPKPPIRHSLDLYKDNTLEKLIRKVAERLELGVSVIEASFSELIEELEKYRLDRKEQEEAQEITLPPLSQTELEEAEASLSGANLLERTQKALAQSGIIGEANNSLIVFLAMTSRLSHNPVSVICLARSGLGKSYLMESVARCMPETELITSTQFTESSFYRYGVEEIKHKVILIEDLDGAQAVLYPIRELQSKREIRKTMTIKTSNGETKTGTLVVKGPVSVVACTTKESIYEDNANRSILIYLDESKDQDQRILTYQKQKMAGKSDPKAESAARKQLQHMQRILEPKKVINPYAPLIELPQEVFKPRRTMALLLHFIEAITFYHQYQRKRTTIHGQQCIESSVEDVEMAFHLLGDVLFRKADELSGACRELYEWIKQEKRKSKEDEFIFKSKDIRQQRRVNPRTLRHYLRELQSYGLIERVGGDMHRGFEYQLNEEAAKENLQDKVQKQLKVVLKRIRASTSLSTLSVQNQADRAEPRAAKLA